MQDEARIHTAYMTMQLPKWDKIQVPLWLEESLDLSPIENLWEIWRILFIGTASCSARCSCCPTRMIFRSWYSTHVCFLQMSCSSLIKLRKRDQVRNVHCRLLLYNALKTQWLSIVLFLYQVLPTRFTLLVICFIFWLLSIKNLNKTLKLIDLNFYFY